LRDRIRQLEGVLGLMHHRRTGQTHPLLGPLPDDDWEDDELVLPDNGTTSGSQNVSEDHGTLLAGQDGSARLFGSIGSALVHTMSVCLSVGLSF
jgi:hypothetical protein